MSLTSCVKQAGSALLASDKAAILARANALRAQGLNAIEAGRQAVDERLAEVQGEIKGIAPLVPEAEPAQAAAAATHQDPGERPEAATRAVVKESLTVGARNAGMKPSEMRAYLLRKIDEAIPNASDEELPTWKAPTKEQIRSAMVTLKTSRPEKAEQMFENLHRNRVAEVSSRIGHVTFDVPGDGKFKVLNTRNRLEEFRKKVEKSPGFKDTSAPEPVARTGLYGEPFGVERGSSGPKAAIENMIDAGDPQAAVDYAAARGLVLADVLKGDKKRLPKVANLAPTEAEPVAEFEQEAPAAPAPSAPTQPSGLPNPWEISQDEFVKLVSFTKEGSTAFPWVAKWGDRILEAQNEEYDHPDLGKTVVMGGRFSKTKREAEAVARGAHKRAVRRAALNGMTPSAEALIAYPDLQQVPAQAQAGATPAEGAGGSRPTPDATITDLGEKIGGARKDMAESGGPSRARKTEDDRPAWARRFEVSQIVKTAGRLDSPRDEGRWVIHDTRSLNWMKQPRQVGQQTFATKEEAEAFVPIAAVGLKHRTVAASGGKYEIWRDINDRKRVKVVDQQFDTRDDAMRYMVQNAVAIIETNTTFGESDIPLPPDRVRRGPPRRNGDVKGEDFLRAFALRGVEFGNWNNQDERQILMNEAWDGLMDLADVLGIPPKAMGLGGELALAFGARGHGLHSARAHYERNRAVINLTKEKGAGTLAHEWLHALDHYLGRQDGKAPSEWVTNKDGTRSLKINEAGDDMVSSGFSRDAKSKARPELRAAFNKVMQTIANRAEAYVADTVQADKFVGRARDEVADAFKRLRADLAEQKDPKYWKRNNKPASADLLAEFDAISQRVIEGENSALATDWRIVNDGKARAASRWTNDTLERLSAIYKEVRGRSGFDAERKGVLDRLRANMGAYEQRLKMLADAQSGATKERQTPTQFRMDAKELDQGRGEDYWTTPHELAARAFQAYVEDKIAERGGVSRFLNYAPENAALPTPWGFKRIYPAGMERKAINEAFDGFVRELKVKEEDGKTVLFSRRGSPISQAAPQTETPAFRRWFGNSKVVDPEGKPLVVYHGTASDISVFDPAKTKAGDVIFTTPDAQGASLYAETKANGGGAANVMPLYVSIRRPAIIKANDYSFAALNAALTRSGVDGVLVIDEEGAIKIAAPVSAEQIKSAIGNAGAFDPENPDIRMNRQGSAAVNLPPAALGGSLARVNNHPDYTEAKAGDTEAAYRLARDLVTDGFVEEVRQLIGAESALLVPVISQESTGRNKIPLAVAEVLADRLGLDTALDVAQVTRPGRGDALSALLKPAEFYGSVQSGSRYVLVDMALDQGGTLASLAQHVRVNGGEVLGVAALSGKRYGATLSLNDETLSDLQKRFGNVEPEFRAATGYGFDALTESEARYLLKHDAPEQVRDRIVAAGREAGFKEDARADGAGARDGRRLSSETPQERFRRLLGVPAQGIPLSTANRLAQAYTDAGLNKVSVAATPEDLPADLRRRFDGAADDVRGAYFPDLDQVWVFSDRVSSPDEFAFVVLHEAFHRGLGQTFGRDARRLLGQMYQTNRRLRERADRIAKELGIDRDTAIEEALADMAAEGKAQKLRGWSKLVAMIRTWLGKLMDALGLRIEFTDAQIETFVAGVAAKGLQSGPRVTTGADVDRLVSASQEADPDAKLLKAIASLDDLFALPKSWSVTPQDIARDIDPGLQVQKVSPDPGKAEQYKITTPSGQTATMYVRTPLRNGPTLYGFDMNEGEMVNVFEGRPGENPEDVDPSTQDVYVDASKLTGQGEGQFVYALAGAFAHNTGRIFIGDPAGLSDAALRRRSEQMLSLALKYGTTKHLAPHPRQTVGAPSLGVPPLKWVYGDDIGNMERLIALNVKAIENAFPDAAKIEFDLESGTFRNAESGATIPFARLRGRMDDRANAAAGGPTGEARAGSRTVARAAVWNALLRQGRQAGRGTDGRPAGVLDGLRDAGRLHASGELKGLFSRRTSTAAGGLAGLGITQQSIRNRLMDQFGKAGAKVHWWHKTLGTQYDKAKSHPMFGRVFDTVQQYLEDTSALANEAADLAPSILPKLDSVRDVFEAGKRGLSAKDRDAIASPVFEGTLLWTRQDGKLVKVDDLKAKADGMATDAMAAQLLRDGQATQGELNSWNALPLPSYEGAVRNRYAQAYLDSPGVVFNDAELRSLYKLSDAQIKQYREFRAAVDTSLDQVVAADALRMLNKSADIPEELRRAAVGDRDAFRAAVDRILTARIEAGGKPEDVQALVNLKADLEDKYTKVDRLKARGYAPLMRFGRYAVSVRGEGDEMDFFGLYETPAEANRMARELEGVAEFRGRVEQSTMSQEQYKLFNAVPLESLEMFAEAIGAEQSEVFQEYLRLAKNNRSALKRLIQRKGIAGFNEDVTRVLASFVTSNARMAAGTINLGQAREMAQDIKEGDTKDEAVKLIEAVENPVETAGPVRGLMFAHFIGGSIASALVNVTQPVMMTTPYLSQWGGMTKASARLLAAARIAAGGKIADKEMAAALRRAEQDGIVSPQEIHHLTAEAMGTLGRNPVLKRAAFLWASPFSLAEQFNRRVSFLAAYQTAKAENIPDPFAFAEKAVIETQGLYNKGNAPNWARNPVGAVALTFKQYSIHYLEWLKRMWNTGAAGSPERAAGRKAVLFALALLLMAGGVEGLPFMEDLNDLFDTFLQAAGITTSAKGWKRDFLANTLGMGDEAADSVMRGFSAIPGIPLDVSMRMGMGNLLPGTGMLLRSNTDVSRDVLELAGPFGSLLGQAKDAGQKALSGDAAGAVKAVLPVGLANMAKGMDIWMTGEYRDTKGRKVMDADEMDGAMKFLGFQPAEIARESSNLNRERRRVQLTRNVESQIADLWAQGLRERDPDMVQEARQELLEWNQTNPESRIAITNAQVLRRLREMQSTRADRFERAAPKELRAGLGL